VDIEIHLKPATRHLKNGDRVFVKSLGASGSVVSPPDSNGVATIQAGRMKVQAQLSDIFLEPANAAPKKAPAPAYSGSARSKSLTIAPQIDLRGLTIEECRDKADKYLDDAYLSGIRQVVLIHGKGTGALRSAIQSMLKNRRHVLSHRPGQYGEGEDGVTVVELEG
jgi:DNA mismatch repair protein MutS2